MEHILYTFWREIAERPEGPMAFRFYLQPAMAILIAIHDGLKDARAGRQPYLMSLALDREQRRENLRNGWRSISRVFLLALALDVVYQLIVLHTIRPLEGLVVAVVLAIIPYVVVRGPTRRIAAHFLHRPQPHHAK